MKWELSERDHSLEPVQSHRHVPTLLQGAVSSHQSSRSSTLWSRPGSRPGPATNVTQHVYSLGSEVAMRPYGYGGISIGWIYCAQVCFMLRVTQNALFEPFHRRTCYRSQKVLFKTPPGRLMSHRGGLNIITNPSLHQPGCRVV